MTETWFDKTVKTRSELRNVAATLGEIAYHCEGVGLGMATKLHHLSIAIYDADENLRIAIDQGIDEECQAAREAVLNIGPACLERLTEAKEITE